MSAYASKVLAVAAAEIGYLEKASNADLDSKTANAGKNNFTKYARDLDAIGFYNGPKNGYEWCDIFVDWCMVKAFGAEKAKELLNHGPCGAGCGFSAQYYKNAGRFHTTDPQLGDQIFFQRNGEICHTGLVESVSGGVVTTIEGNTSGASGVISNGGGVCRKYYNVGDNCIYGYGRPNYDIEEEEEMPKYQTIAEVPDWGKATVQKLVDAGALKGDETGLNLSEDMTRILVILDRLGKL